MGKGAKKSLKMQAVLSPMAKNEKRIIEKGKHSVNHPRQKWL